MAFNRYLLEIKTIDDGLRNSKRIGEILAWTMASETLRSLVFTGSSLASTMS